MSNVSSRKFFHLSFIISLNQKIGIIKCQLDKIEINFMTLSSTVYIDLPCQVQTLSHLYILKSLEEKFIIRFFGIIANNLNMISL